MGYQVDHTLSVEQNLLNLVNTMYEVPSRRKLVQGDFTPGIPQATEVNPLDGSNTLLELTPVEGKGLVGSATVRYERFSLAENRPSAGQSLRMFGEITHATVKARILEVQRLVGSEVEWSEPATPPGPGESAEYTLTAKEDSTLYTPGELVITVFNTNEPVA